MPQPDHLLTASPHQGGHHDTSARPPPHRLTSLRRPPPHLAEAATLTPHRLCTATTSPRRSENSTRSVSFLLKMLLEHFCKFPFFFPVFDFFVNLLFNGKKWDGCCLPFKKDKFPISEAQKELEHHLKF
jgi:hypothetical protein